MLVDSTSAHLHGGLSVDRAYTPELLHTDAPEKALIGTLGAIPWQGWLDTSLATASGSSTPSDWITQRFPTDHSGM